MKTTGLKVAVILLVAIVIAGLAFAGWGGGRRGGGWYGPGIERGVQDDTDEQGPWVRPGPRWGGPEADARQGLAPEGGPGRGRSGPYAYAPRARGQRFGRGFDGAGGPGTRFGRGGRAGRGFQGADICPFCQGSGWRPVLQRRPMRGNWEQGLRGGRAGGGFRGGAGLPGRGAWGRPGRGLQGGNFGPQRPEPMMRRGPMEENRGRVFGPGRGVKGFRRGNAPAPERQGQGLDRPDRGERPSPIPEWGRSREDRPGLRRGSRGPAEERPEEQSPDSKTPAETDQPKEDQPTSDGV